MAFFNLPARLTTAETQLKRSLGENGQGLLDNVNGQAKAALSSLKTKANNSINVLKQGEDALVGSIDGLKASLDVNNITASQPFKFQQPFSFDIAQLQNQLAQMGGIGPTENQLKSYASYNYIITLACLTTNELNFPDSTYRVAPPQVTVLRSGGGAPGKARTAYETADAQLEYFIDEFSLDTIIAPTSRTRTSNATMGSFVIQEPYSMGLFLQTLMIAANNAGHADYLKAPYAIIIEFKGYDDNGNLYTGANTTTRRVFPIKINKVDFDVNSGGSTYNCTFHAWNESALSNGTQMIKQDTTIVGDSVLELLQAGPESLTGIINRAIRDKAREAKTVNKDEYVIMFPPELISSLGISNKAGTQADSKAAMTEREFYRSVSGIDPESAFDFELEAAGEAYDQYINLQASNNNLSATIKKLAEDTGLANEIGKGTIAKSMAEGGATPFGREFVNEPNSDVYTTDRIQVSNNFREFKFSQSSTIEQVIEEIVILSSYGKNAATVIQPDSNGMIPWFRIHTQTFLVPDEEVRKVSGENPKIFVYSVVPYDVHSSVFSGVSQPSTGIDERKKKAAKTYDYIYTGQNDDIIDFEINFNNAFFKAISSNVNGTGDTKLATKDATNNPVHPIYGAADGTDNVSLAGSQNLAEDPNPVKTGQGGGSDNNSPEVNIARLFNESIVNNEVDLITMELTVLGDPYYLADTGQGNYNSPTVDPSYTKDGTMNYQRSEIEVNVNFRTPIDYNENSGGMVFPQDTIPVKTFSGLYKVNTVKNSLSGGKFTQVLSLIRRPNQEDDIGIKGTAADSKAIVPRPEDAGVAGDQQNPTVSKTGQNAGPGGNGGA